MSKTIINGIIAWSEQWLLINNSYKKTIFSLSLLIILDYSVKTSLFSVVGCFILI